MEHVAAVNGKCPLCGDRTDPQIPFAIFVQCEDGPADVCDACARKHEPALARLLEMFYFVQNKIYGIENPSDDDQPF